MYKFKSNKPKQQGSIDGMLSNGPRRPKIGSNKLNKKPTIEGFNNSYSNSLDDFKKQDGYTRRASPQIDDKGIHSNTADSQLNDVFGRSMQQGLSDTTDKKTKKWYKFNKLRNIGFKKATLMLFVMFLLVGGFLFGKAWWNAHKVFQGGGSALFSSEIDPNMLNKEGDGRVNILLLGKGGDNQSNGPDLTDSLLIISLDPVNDKVALLSIPRDLWVQPEGYGHMKINAVYANAKYSALSNNPEDESAAESTAISTVTDVVEENLGINMHYYAMIDFAAFEEVVNILGGIDVTLEEPYSDPTMLVGSRYFSLPEGTSHLDGGHALAYARSRYGSERGDFDRGEHQQKVVVAIKDKALSLGTFANPLKISQLLSTFGDRVRTNLSIDDMMRVYDFSKKVSNENVSHFDMAQKPDAVVTTGSIGNQSVVLPIAGVDNFDDVKAFVRTKLRDGYLEKENASVIVLNGSSVSGAAQKRADELKGWGYSVIQVSDAPNQSITSTMIVDNTDGYKKYTRHYLEKRFNSEAVDSIDGMDLSQYTADFIIVVGPKG
jgi:LCP family protein required for cell wall assembly